MDGVYISVSPMFVKDIRTTEAGGSGNIVSLLEPKRNSFESGAFPRKRDQFDVVIYNCHVYFNFQDLKTPSTIRIST